MSDMTTFSSGANESFSSELNNNFKHSAISSPGQGLIVSPTNASTMVELMVKADVTRTTSIDGTYDLNSDQDGDLDTIAVDIESNGGDATIPITLYYLGNLSSAAHTLTIQINGGAAGTLGNIKMSAKEFL